MYLNPVNPKYENDVIEFSLRRGEAIVGAGGRMIYNYGEITEISKSLSLPIKRASSGLNMSLTEYSNTGPGTSRVAFSGVLPGDAIHINIQKGDVVILKRASLVCCDRNVKIDGTNNLKEAFKVEENEGFFLPRATVDTGNVGRVWVSAFGTVIHKVLAKGESIRVDNGCFLACHSTDESKPYTAVDGIDISKAILSGEGFAMEFNGPMNIWMQNKNIKEFANVVQSFQKAPKKSLMGMITGGGDEKENKKGKSKSKDLANVIL